MNRTSTALMRNSWAIVLRSCGVGLTDLASEKPRPYHCCEIISERGRKTKTNFFVNSVKKNKNMFLFTNAGYITTVSHVNEFDLLLVHSGSQCNPSRTLQLQSGWAALRTHRHSYRTLFVNVMGRVNITELLTTNCSPIICIFACLMSAFLHLNKAFDLCRALHQETR